MLLKRIARLFCGSTEGRRSLTYAGNTKDRPRKMASRIGELEKAWGRKAEATWFTAAASLVLVVGCPLWLFINWIALEHFEGSMTSAVSAVGHDGLTSFVSQYTPRPSMRASLAYVAWLVLQGTLYSVLPGPISTGQLTPAGNLLRYKTNGLLAWTITHIAFIGAGVTGMLDLAIIANNWEGLLVASNIYGFLLAGFCLIKGHLAPSHPNDRKFSGSLIFDYFVGIELNPRFGELWDFKLFHNGRPGIIAWTLISISYTALQYQKIGYVTNSLWLVDLFHFIYVVDFFINEDWYLRTIDMAHDHYGYYLGWGSVALLPSVYTIQAQYLGRYPVDLSGFQVAAVLLLGLGGYALFRAANHQKDIVRSTDGRCNIWGKPAKYIRASYKTEDGKTHESLLLTSGICANALLNYISALTRDVGWWGFSRHANYLGDLMQASAMGAACGVAHLMPWLYTLFISAILINRVPRDEARCSRKYGKNWQVYTDKVRWRILPGLV